MRMAIVGSGAAAAGALHALFELVPDAEVVLYESGEMPAQGPPLPPQPSMAEVREFYDTIYGSLKQRYGRHILPTKSHLGEECPTERVNGQKRFFRVERFGGETNFWGGCVLPFQKAELAGWPIGPGDLAPHYRAIADLVGIAGERDALNECYDPDYANRPPVRVLRGVARLRDSVNAASARGAYAVYAGVPRMMVETRPGHAATCTYCGECGVGCFAGSVYAARSTVSAYLQARRVVLVRARVLRIDPQRRALAVRRHDAVEWDEGFDRIFLCAGCVGTTELVMRSTGVHEGPVMVDSAIAQVPIFNFGLRRGSAEPATDRYFGLAQLLMACVPREPDGDYGQFQLYANLDFLWRTGVPDRLWPLARAVLARARDRILMGRLCTHSRHGYAYRLRLDAEDRLQFEDLRVPDRGAMKPMLASLRSVINRNGFYMYPGPPLMAGTSAHLAGTLPYGGALFSVPRDGQVLPGVHICDSSVFLEAHAASPTFTVMANAHRTVTEALA